MKKFFWFTSMATIFLNTVIAIFFNDYPLVSNILLNLSILAIVFMAYVIFIEKKTSTVTRSLSILFGISGIANVVFKIVSLQNDLINIILGCILLAAIITIGFSLLVKVFTAE